jgi:hypothetical protein
MSDFAVLYSLKCRSLHEPASPQLSFHPVSQRGPHLTQPRPFRRLPGLQNRIKPYTETFPVRGHPVLANRKHAWCIAGTGVPPR